jgi:hypothetical protein
MSILHLNLRRRRLLTSMLLGLVLLRAYIPAGFMPQSGNPLQLEVCPAGMPMMAHDAMGHDAMAHDAMAHDALHTDGTGAQLADCPFGHSPAAGPIVHHIVPVTASAGFSQPIVPADAAAQPSEWPRAHQARGPPSPA